MPNSREKRLFGVVRSLNSIMHLDTLLTRIIASAVEMMEATGGALLMVDKTGCNLIFEVAWGGASAQLKGMVIPIDERSVAGFVALRGQPYVENDTRSSRHFSGQVDRDTGYKTRKLVCVPLKIQSRLIGVLEVIDKVSGRDFDFSDVELLEVLADAAAVAIENAHLYEEERRKSVLLQQAYDELQNTYGATLQALMSALDTRDDDTHSHSNRVAAYTLRLAHGLGISDPAQLSALQQGALLHDVGKIGVSDSILRKPGPLTEEEWEEMRRHPELGYTMLKGIGFLSGALPVVRYHHERWDGTGYPHGLSGEAIPLGARIFAVADTFDAVTSHRPYSRARSYEEAKDIVIADSGKCFDPKVVDAFLRVPEEEWQKIRHSISATLAASLVTGGLDASYGLPMSRRITGLTGPIPNPQSPIPNP
jgi:hypothetical protein